MKLLSNKTYNELLRQIEYYQIAYCEKSREVLRLRGKYERKRDEKGRFVKKITL